jgi:tRNA(Ile)-lysidine synthase
MMTLVAKPMVSLQTIDDKSAVASCDRAFALAMLAMGFFEKNPLIIVAFSGGSDSLALLLLMQNWCSERGGRVIAVTIDHGLRAESKDEALWAENFCQSHGIDHHIITLDWAKNRPVSGVMQKARAARYEALLNFCRDQGALHLALGHTANDQAETLAIRLEDQSGEMGLQGMKAVTYRREACLIRPLLHMPRALLQQYCRAKNMSWLSDPTNDNQNFARVRHRFSLTPDEVQQHLATAAFYQQKYQDHFAPFIRAMVKHVALYPEGRAFIKNSFSALPLEAQIFILRALLRTLAGTVYLPSEQKIKSALKTLLQADFKAMALHHVIITRKSGKNTGFWCYPEERTAHKAEKSGAGEKNAFFQKDAGYGRLLYPAKSQKIMPYGYSERSFFDPPLGLSR